MKRNNQIINNKNQIQSVMFGLNIFHQEKEFKEMTWTNLLYFKIWLLDILYQI